ncbi:glycosyltransferase family 4 protein [Paenibacillus taichungensis]|uniref:glycosyltransferase family 4 protein n=1 Tax=Paenibacillus taichungensis TaxID=484184 RepID=UPI002DBF6337|nr:glycosyltransferase family 4 protein [Paenibacillus taichungensis]MEC0106654.1 glycosyltransferase family 4 protein [Paenibacillus taichungensis]MEC0198580.1 glycosyltransferase family 4 protein [Paenibacillus taichungensis]
MLRTLLITNQIAPYRIPVYNKINQSESIDFTVWFLQEKESNREWNIDYSEMEFAHEQMRGFHIFLQKLDMGIHLNPGLFWRLIRFNPDVVMTTGYEAPGYWTGMLYAKIFRKRFVVWYGSTLHSSRVQNKLFNSIRKFFFGRADAFVSYGTESAKCMEHYGVDPEKIVIGYNTVDVKYYRQHYKESRKASRQNEARIQFLYIGQLIERKGLLHVLQALSKLETRNWEFKIVGSGSDEAILRKKVEEYGLSDRVLFEGYKQKEQLGTYLAQADCLIFPSLIEVWGLVVNEALATNTFVLASKYAGATKDIIADKQNGLVIDPLDQRNMIEAFQWVMGNKEYIQSQRSQGLSLWRKLHPNSYARSVETAIKKAAL